MTDPVRAWARRSVEIRREFAAITDVDPRWWVLAAGIAFAEVWAPPELYLASDAEADADTFMGHRAPAPRALVADAIRRAHAARTALRELDGQLPEQPLAVTIDRTGGGGARPNRLEVAAFAIGRHCVVARLDDPTLATQLAGVLDGANPPPHSPGEPPFVCVAIGEEPVATARHGHRRAWTGRGGPWLGLGRAGELAVVSTCHLIVDGYGHARLAARIAELTAEVADDERAGPSAPPLAPVADAVALAVVWRALPYPTPRVIPLAYAAGRLLHRLAGRRDARFSPTLQIPVARGAKDDPLRLHRRVVSATTAVQFDRGEPEPFEVFEARLRASISREAASAGLVSRLLAAARAVPVPLAWKRRGIGAKRPPWLDRFAEVIGGRALLSRIAIDVPAPHLCAVSSPSRLASADDPSGGCVITIIDDGTRGTITLCGSGATGTVTQAGAFLDELLASV